LTRAFPDRALVLAAGRGTRLGVLSSLRAKPALPVAGQPLVRRTLAWLARQGIRDAVVNLHHRPETITAVVGDGRDLGVRVRYSWEQPLLGSAGGPRHALPLVDAPRLWIVNGDTLHALDLAPMHAAHLAAGARVTMALVPNARPDRYGGVIVEDGRVVRFVPRGTPGPSFHFIGVQLAEADVFAGLPDGEPAESVSGVYRALVAGTRSSIAAYIADVPFHDIGTPADYLATSLAVARAEGLGDRLPPGRGARIDAGARLARTAIWDDVTIAAGVALVECIVGDGASVPEGTRLARRVLVPAAAVDAPAGAARLDALLVVPLSEDVGA
jgi:NDP-sugar pyrophosphorylase family protein